VYSVNAKQIARDGSVFSFGNTFFDGSIPSLQRRDTVDPVDALKGAVGALQLPVDTSGATAEAEEAHETYTFKSTSGTVSEPKARLVYLIAADGKLALTWRVETDIVDNWLLTYYSANGGEEVHGVVDYVADATYQV
jgi:extracellular elastinolytic metalloproteinase